MLKLSQIRIEDPTDVVVEMLEPIVYTLTPGGVEKTSETILKEKNNSIYSLGKIVHVSYKKDLEENINSPFYRNVKVGDIVMFNKTAVEPIQFPIDGYNQPMVGILSKYSISAIIEEDN